MRISCCRTTELKTTMDGQKRRSQPTHDDQEEETQQQAFCSTRVYNYSKKLITDQLMVQEHRQGRGASTYT